MSVSNSTQPENPPTLTRTLRQRHVAMISIGGIIGAGSSSAAAPHRGRRTGGDRELRARRARRPAGHAHAGRDGGRRSARRLVHRIRAARARQLGGLHRAAGSTGISGSWWSPIEAIAGAAILQLWIAAAGLADRPRADGAADRRQPAVDALVRRVRVLVRLDQGRGDRRLHRDRGGVRARLTRRRARRSAISPRTAASRRSARGGARRRDQRVFALCGAEIATVAAAESAEPRHASRDDEQVSCASCCSTCLDLPDRLARAVARDRAGHSPFAAALDRMRIPGAADDHERDRADGGAVVPELGLYVARGCCSRSPRTATRRNAGDGDARRCRWRFSSSLFGYLASSRRSCRRRWCSRFSSTRPARSCCSSISDGAGQIRIRRRIERDARASDIEDVALSVAVVCGGGGDPWRARGDGRHSALRPQLMASLASLAVASAAYLLAAKRHPRSGTSASDDTATGYRSQAARPAWGGRR